MRQSPRIRFSAILFSQWLTKMLPLAAMMMGKQLWYIVPLILSVSLVYGATRHELPRPILYHAWHTALWMLVFMGVIFAVLWLVSWSL